MTIRSNLAREFREFPATSLMCVTWIVVFAAMSYLQHASGEPMSATGWLLFGFGGGGRFGDLTLQELQQGQVWRLLTCNFVHYSLLHLAFNLLAMYQLGSMVESWYGGHQFIFVCGLVGVFGNLLSAAGRWWTRSSGIVHSAGGSVVIMGLVGLCAVAGWRSRTPEGRWLARVLSLFAASTAALGWLFPGYIDNWGHAGGFVVGTVLGLAHRRFLAAISKPAAFGAGILTLLVMLIAAGAQFAVDRRDSPGRLVRTLEVRTEYLVLASAELNRLRSSSDQKIEATRVASWLKSLEPWLDAPAQEGIQALRPLVEEAARGPLPESRRHELDQQISRTLTDLRRNYQAVRKRLARPAQKRLRPAIRRPDAQAGGPGGSHATGPLARCMRS